MAKDKTQGMQRIDLRIPDYIYSEIERIAIANNLPYSPTTKPNTDGSLKVDKKGNVIQPKVSVSPIILDLINLGLKAIANGEENSDKLGDKTRPIEYQVNNQIDVAEIEKKIINTLNQRLEGIVSDKLELIIESKVTEAINKLTDNFTSDLTEIKPDIPINYDTNTDNQIIDNTDNITVDNTPSESSDLTFDEDLGNNLTKADNEGNKSDISEIKSFDEAIKEIKRLNKKEIGNTAIARSLTGKFYTKGNKTNWSDTQVRRILEKEK